MKTTEEFFNQLIRIKDEINEQIPLATNRYEDFECMDANEDPDVIDQKYFEHEQRLEKALIEHYAFSYLNESYTKFNSYDQEQLQVYLNRNISLLLEKIKRTGKYVKNFREDIADDVIAYLQQNMNELVKRLCRGEVLTVDYYNFSERFEKDIRVKEFRELRDSYHFESSITSFVESLDLKSKENWLKHVALNSGVYADRLQIDMGYCDEHTCLGLVRILKRCDLKDVIIEKVSITYLDANNSKDDGHTFLAINRNPHSRLNDISSWGEEAVLFDPWNKLVCRAADFRFLPKHYFSYPPGLEYQNKVYGAEWSSITFDENDASLLDETDKFDWYFAKTCHNDPVKREQALKEEYHLTSLNIPDFTHTRLFLDNLVAEIKPDNFNLNIEILITTSGTQLVSIPKGFSIPKIALHKDFLMGIQPNGQGKYSLEELRFGLATALYQIKSSPFSLEVDDRSHSDVLALQKCRNSSAAISYLQKEIEFRDIHGHNKSFKLLKKYSGFHEDYAQRIKQIITEIAQDESTQNNVGLLKITCEVLQEVEKIQIASFFAQGLKECVSKVDKMNYLKSCVSELKKELLPYELTKKRSIRLKEFCHLLIQVGLDLKEPDQMQAADELIDEAFHLEVPGFERIYLAIFNQRSRSVYSSRFPALGPFKKMQQALTDFVYAENYSIAFAAAEQIVNYGMLIKNHFLNINYYIDFKKLINNEQRFFYSGIGNVIQWQSFSWMPIEVREELPKNLIPNSYLFINNPNNFVLYYIDQYGQKNSIAINEVEGLDDILTTKESDIKFLFSYSIKEKIASYVLRLKGNLPWEKHMDWANQDKSKIIANALWYAGVTRDKRIWSCFTYDEIKQKTKSPYKFYDTDNTYKGNHIFPLVDLEGELMTYGDHITSTMVAFETKHHFSNTHELKTDMFNGVNDFEQSFLKFYDANLPALENVTRGFNENSPAVMFLLNKFCEIALVGSEKDKQVVKSFFMGRKDHKDLAHLRAPDSYLNHDSPYVEFFFLQRLRQERLPLALIEELIKNLDVKSLELLLSEDTSKLWIQMIREKNLKKIQHQLSSDPSVRRLIFEDQIFKLSFLPQFQGETFQLFTEDEIFEIYKNTTFFSENLSLLSYIFVLQLNYQTLSLECLQQLIPLLEQKKLPWVIDAVINKHIKDTNAYNLVSRESVIIADFLITYLGMMQHTDTRKKVLASFQGSLPQSLDEVSEISASDLITLYRIFDWHFHFKSFEEQSKFGQLVLEKINLIINKAEQNLLLEKLIFTNKTRFPLALNDIQLRNQAIHLCIKNIFATYGKDTGSDEYYKHMTAIIDHIYSHMDVRDSYYMLSSLANTIESQLKLSEYIGIIIEPEKYYFTPEDDRKILGIKKTPDEKKKWIVILVEFLGHEESDRLAMLNFLSSSLSQASLHTLSQYIIENDRLKTLSHLLKKEIDSLSLNQGSLEYLLQLTYNGFWQASLQERTVLVDYLLIPSHAMISEESSQKAYESAFTYVTGKLFPNSVVTSFSYDENENFAVAFLRAYLNTADNKYVKNYLLAGMLVATNEFDSDKKTSIGHKLAVICEHLGPAYVKLAQAIHSHPSTPETIRQDLSHMKGKANPPTRWQLWRLIQEVLIAEDKSAINRLGSLLGSASFNIAVEVQVKEGKDAVLLLQRENAEKDAERGFKHLYRAVNVCDHEKMSQIREIGLTLIEQTHMLSHLEMDYKSGDLQGKLAEKMYNMSREVMIDNTRYEMNIYPSTTLRSQAGYRFITRINGTEFNDLPIHTKHDALIKKEVAKAMLAIELSNILRGGCFDCDRHGNQLRVFVDAQRHRIIVGLYDFGEMGLQVPSKTELQQLANFIKIIPDLYRNNQSIENGFSDYINQLSKRTESTQYLLRINRGLLALHDFKKHINDMELFGILKSIGFYSDIHPELKKIYLWSLAQLSMTEIFSQIKSRLKPLQTSCSTFFSHMNNKILLSFNKQTMKQEVKAEQTDLRKRKDSPNNPDSESCKKQKSSEENQDMEDQSIVEILKVNLSLH